MAKTAITSFIIIVLIYPKVIHLYRCVTRGTRQWDGHFTCTIIVASTQIKIIKTFFQVEMYHTNSRPCLTHFFYFWSCSLKVLIFYLEWKFINWPWKPIFLIWKFKFQLLNLVPSVWNAPESIGKWSRQQTGAPFLAYCKDMKYLLFLDNKCEVHVYVYDRSFGLKVTLATISLIQLGDILMDRIMSLCIFLLLLCSGASLHTRSCLTFFKDSQVKTPFCEIDRCIRIVRLRILIMHMVAYSSNLLKSIAAVWR